MEIQTLSPSTTPLGAPRCTQKACNFCSPHEIWLLVTFKGTRSDYGHKQSEADVSLIIRVPFLNEKQAVAPKSMSLRPLHLAVSYQCRSHRDGHHTGTEIQKWSSLDATPSRLREVPETWALHLQPC